MARRSTGRRHLGLDLGGTNVKWAVVAHDDGWHVVDEGQVPTHAEEGPDAVVDRLAALGARVLEADPAVATVGVGVPGLYDPAAGTIRFLPNLPGPWAGMPAGDRLARALDRPTALINDARAFGLAELRLGAGRGVRSIIGLTIGTGVGGVVAIDGRVLQGRDGTAGELGHQTIEPDGPPCGCGSRGCLETLARADRIAEACGAPTAEEAVRRARAGDPAASSGMARVGRYLGIGLANIVTVLTPDRIVIGGGLAAAFDLVAEPIRAELRERVRTTSLEGVEVVTAELGILAGAIGAAIHGAEQAADATNAEAPEPAAPAGTAAR